jgi:hypothetical protein
MYAKQVIITWNNETYVSSRRDMCCHMKGGDSLRIRAKSNRGDREEGTCCAKLPCVNISRMHEDE